MGLCGTGASFTSADQHIVCGLLGLCIDPIISALYEALSCRPLVSAAGPPLYFSNYSCTTNEALQSTSGPSPDSFRPLPKTSKTSFRRKNHLIFFKTDLHLEVQLRDSSPPNLSPPPMSCPPCLGVASSAGSTNTGASPTSASRRGTRTVAEPSDVAVEHTQTLRENSPTGPSNPLGFGSGSLHMRLRRLLSMKVFFHVQGRV